MGAFYNNILKQNIDFETILKVIYDFLSHVYFVIFDEDKFFKVWNPIVQNKQLMNNCLFYS